MEEVRIDVRNQSPARVMRYLDKEKFKN